MSILNKTKNSIKNLNEKRQINSDTYKATNIMLLLCFPVFLTFLCEIIQMKSVSKFIVFLFTKPTIILFDVFLIGAIFIAFLFLFRKGWVAVLIEGILFATLSIVELFKFGTNGNHFILTDVKVSFNAAGLGNLTSFAYIKITPQLILMVALLFIYIGFVFWYNPILKMKSFKRVATSVLSFGLIYAFIATPAIATPVYSFFDIDTSREENFFKVNEKFDNNNFLAFLAQTTTEGLNKAVKEPDDYSVDAMTSVLDTKENDNSTSSVRPNVIVIMSESFADFRDYDNLEIDPEIYKDFDEIRNEGFAGKTVVPTFASFTVKTEFELNFGLPVKSLNDPNMPQKLLPDREQVTIPSYYKSLGYNTNYIHTFSKTFYGRDRIYKNFGYDNMYWEDSMTVPVEYYKAYISDTTIFNQMEKIMKDSDKPVYIHATTMQNHQPYDDPDMTQFDYYQAGLKDMLGNLKNMLKDIKASGEPTVVFFVGDHFPSLKEEGSVYNELGINGDNCNSLYVQNYFFWDNYGLDYSKVSEEPYSVFYTPYVILDLIGAPKNDIIDTMLSEMKTTPIYSTNYDIDIPDNETIDSITYDLVLGEQYLKGVQNETDSQRTDS